MPAPKKEKIKSGIPVQHTYVDLVGGIYSLDEIDKKLLRLKIKYSQISYKDMSDAVGITMPAVQKRIEKPAFKHALEEYNRPRGKLFEDIDRAALKALEGLLSDSDKLIRLKAIEIYMRHIAGPQMVVNNNVQTQVTKVYKTTVQPDGTLLQQVLDLELGQNPEEPFTLNVPKEGEHE